MSCSGPWSSLTVAWHPIIPSSSPVLLSYSLTIFLFCWPDCSACGKWGWFNGFVPKASPAKVRYGRQEKNCCLINLSGSVSDSARHMGLLAFWKYVQGSHSPENPWRQLIFKSQFSGLGMLWIAIKMLKAFWNFLLRHKNHQLLQSSI